MFVLGCIHWRIGGGGGGEGGGSGFREASNFTKFSQIEGQFNVKHLLNTIKHFPINTSSIKSAVFNLDRMTTLLHTEILQPVDTINNRINKHVICT